MTTADVATDVSVISVAQRPEVPLDLSTHGRFHVVGAGGPGMSALALVLAEMGHQVTGSDVRESLVLDRLRAGGVPINVPHDRSVVDGSDAVTYSTAIPANNIELDAARQAGIMTVHRSGMLASMCAQAKSLGVAGTHGKTTTTSMLMLAMSQAGWRPSFVIGGDVTDIGTGAQWTGGEWFIVEADESDKTHLALPLYGTILTNVEADHLEHYGTLEAIIEGFDTYLRQIPGPKVVCADDPVCARLAAEIGNGTVTYGLSAAADYRAVDPVASTGSYRFRVRHGSDDLGQFVLPLRGIHNVVNATAVVAMATEVGVGIEHIRTALSRFGGVARRFDVRGTLRGATLIDDYAHLPTEIDAVLRAARDSGDGWQRVVAVFQPNRFRRMAVLSPEYRDAFAAADLVIVTDIYPSGDAPIPGVTGKLVVDAVLDAHPWQRMVWLPRRDDLVDYLAGELRGGDVCVSMGCGDIAQLPTEILTRAAELGLDTPDRRP
jgi:UDP-N-acetylmuramate--alanine ligase